MVREEEIVKERLNREAIAIRAAKELFDGAVVNLGIGIPILVSSFVPERVEVIYHTENGALGLWCGGYR
jgi:acyl CoA:acetate/3-ketoacid CoA transferase beta subunit